MKVLKNAGLVALSALALTATSNALATQAGDILVRVGAVHVAPTTKPEDNGLNVDVEADTQLGINFTYMVSDSLGVEVLGATPFTQDLTIDGSKVGEAKHLPPTVTLQLHLNPTGTIRPYVGAGFNYTMMLESKLTGPLAGVPLELSDSFGLAGEAGVDVDLGNGFFLNAAAWYADINTDASVNGGQDIEVQVDPWVFMAGVGTTF